MTGRATSLAAGGRSRGMNRFGLGGTAEQPVDEVIEILEAGPNVLKIAQR